MNDKMTPDKERENCPCRKAIINPFDAMMMVVVRRLDKAYLELKRSKPPAKEAEFALRNAKLSFYGELVRQSIETVFSPEEIIALYENDDLAGGAWTVWNDIGCPVEMMGIDSCGMLISAVHHEEGEEKLHLLMLDPHIPAGAKMY